MSRLEKNSKCLTDVRYLYTYYNDIFYHSYKIRNSDSP